MKLLSDILLYFPRVIHDRVEGLITQHSIEANYSGINICGYNLSPWNGQNERFVRLIIEALKIIQKEDPIKFKRIRRNIHYIRFSRLGHGFITRYVICKKILLLDWTKIVTADMQDSDPPIELFLYLINVSTYGSFIKRRPVYFSPRKKSKIKRICVTEEARFFDRIVSGKGKEWFEVRMSDDSQR